jgi:sugar/nucleoside kinase (ribokinase family)
MERAGMAQDLKLLVVGSIGIDTVETPVAKREAILGGSASYACVAASYFSPTGLVGVVGQDFSDQYMSIYRNASIDLEGLQVKEGETFRWSGIYEENMDNRQTISTELNVFESFSPDLPASYTDIPYVFLGNISPDLQLHVLEQVKNPKFVMVDTMDLWINIARADLLKVIARVDMLTVNDSEARMLTDAPTLVQAAKKLLDMGPRYILVKRGEHGSTLFSKDSIFLLSAYPLETVVDPTGAGDTFAGAFMGALAQADGAADEKCMRQAMLTGSVVASFGVEDFSLDRLEKISKGDIDARLETFRAMLRV